MFAHNRHLQKQPSFWQLADFPLTRWSAGSIVAHLGADYTLLAMAFGAVPDRGLDAPAPDTLEGVLAGLPASRYIFRRAAGLHRPSATQSRAPTIHPNKGYFPLVPEHLDGVDGVLFLRSV